MAETPDPANQPSEDELRTMLEERDEVQATTQHQLARIGTRILGFGFAAVVIGFFSFSDNREAVASMFREPLIDEAPPSPAPRALQAKPAAGEESASDELIRATNNINAVPTLSPDGKVVSKEDIGFVMELLNFAQGPPVQHVAPAPAEKAKDP